MRASTGKGKEKEEETKSINDFYMFVGTLSGGPLSLVLISAFGDMIRGVMMNDK